MLCWERAANGDLRFPFRYEEGSGSWTEILLQTTFLVLMLCWEKTPMVAFIFPLGIEREWDLDRILL